MGRRVLCRMRTAVGALIPGSSTSRRPRSRSGQATHRPCYASAMTSRLSKWITCGRDWQRPVCKLTDTRRAPLGIGPQVRLPEANNLPTARPDVLVLGLVKGHPATDASFVACALPVVPVVAVKLDDETGRRDRRVGGELSAEGRLLQVLHAEAVEQCVAEPFGPRRATELLPSVHLEQHGAALGVGVATSERAVGDPVGAGRRAGRGPAEGAATYLARVLGLAFPLGRVVADERAVAPFALGHAAGRNVEGRPTPLAGSVLTSATLRARRRSVAGQRAVARSRRAPLGHLHSASVANERSHPVSRSTLSHNPHSTATVNPIGVMTYA